MVSAAAPDPQPGGSPPPFAGAPTTAGPPGAISAAQLPEANDNPTRIAVTGSRIERDTHITPAPLTVLSRKDLDAYGRSTLGDILLQLPVQTSATDAQVNDIGVQVENGDGSTSPCTATDIRLQPVPAIPGGPVLSSDCHDVRATSGPDVADSMIVVWTSSAGDVEARYIGGGGLDVARPIALSGSAPKVGFDGTRFWIAWLDGQDALQLASFDPNGRVVPYSLPGWVPIGPEAFELVHRGNEAGLTMLTAGSLDFLTICN